MYDAAPVTTARGNYVTQRRKYKGTKCNLAHGFQSITRREFLPRSARLAYGDTPAVVMTGREWPPAKKSFEFSFGRSQDVVDVKLAPRYRIIWLVGAAILCQRFLELGLVDEIKLTMAPVLWVKDSGCSVAA